MALVEQVGGVADVLDILIALHRQVGVAERQLVGPALLAAIVRLLEIIEPIKVDPVELGQHAAVTRVGGATDTEFL